MLLDIYNMKMDYDDAFEFYCFENCYRSILKYYGVKNSMFFIDATLNLVYTEAKSEKHGYNLRVNTNRSSFLPHFESKVHVYKDEAITPEAAWKINKEKLDTGIPIIAGVDVFHLAYQPSYNKIHGAHGVILCGYSEDESVVSIIDWYKPWFYKGNIEMPEFLKARASKNPWDGNIFSGITIGNAWIEVDEDNWNFSDEELVNMFICTTIDRYYTNENFDRGNIPNDETIVSQGVFALKDTLKSILRYEQAPQEERNDFLLMLHKNMFKVSRRKKLFKYYMETAARSFELKEIDEVIKATSLIIEKWERLILTILKASMINSSKHYQSIKDLMGEAIKYEEELYDYLLKVKYAL